MSDAASSIELHTFERVDAGPNISLLRLAGRRSPEDDPATPPVLLIDLGNEQRELSSLPGPLPPTGVLQLAYPTPVDVLDAAVGFALRLPDQSAFSLPAPVVRGPRPEQDAPAPAPPPPQAEPEEQFEAIDLFDLALTQREAVLAARELALEAAQEKLAASERALGELRATAASLAAQLDEAQAREQMLSEVVQTETARREELAGRLREQEQKQAAEVDGDAQAEVRPAPRRPATQNRRRRRPPRPPSASS